MDPKFFRKYADIITEAEKVDEAGPPGSEKSAMDAWLNSPVTRDIEKKRDLSHSPSPQPGQNPVQPNPNSKPTQEAELDEVVRVQGIDPRTGKLYDPQNQDQRDELARIANYGRWDAKERRIGGLKPGSQGSANQRRVSPDRISIAGSDNPGTQPGTRVTNKPAKGFMGTSLGAARPANVGKGK